MGWESRKVGSLFGIGTIGSASLNVNASLKFKHSKSHCKHELSLSDEAVVWIKKEKILTKFLKLLSSNSKSSRSLSAEENILRTMSKVICGQICSYRFGEYIEKVHTAHFQFTCRRAVLISVCHLL